MGKKRTGLKILLHKSALLSQILQVNIPSFLPANDPPKGEDKEGHISNQKSYPRHSQTSFSPVFS